jgi:hypothetical protein
MARLHKVKARFLDETCTGSNILHIDKVTYKYGNKQFQVLILKDYKIY